MKSSATILIYATIIGCLLFAQPGHGANLPIPAFQFGVGEAEGPEDVAVVLQIVALMTVLSLAPAIMILMTSFTRLVIVFHFLRQAIGTQQSPPNQVIVGLALFMTFFIMTPVWQEVNEHALAPYLAEEIAFTDALEKAKVPLQKFMMANTRENDLALFISASGQSQPRNKSEVSLLTLIPAFVISELKTAFIIGFVLYVPFLVIDMVVASVLLSMGMMMLPPVMISLPFKLMLFVLVDGWHLVAGSMIKSFGVSP
ncbi:MAG: flagellar type III secretion system pore protein FliP [Desulfobacterales bacterium]|nr:flagellar type III secretion system pore protein FliP [Desulfobacterales bacterium]